jgi:hypothetical protein
MNRHEYGLEFEAQIPALAIVVQTDHLLSREHGRILGRGKRPTAPAFLLNLRLCKVCER